MKAAVQEQYGAPHELLTLRDVDEPAPGDGQVRVRVSATSVNAADWHLLRGEPRIARLQLGLRAPKVTVLGCDVAGEVEALGTGVSGLAAGDEVFGSTFDNGYGAFAESVVVAADLVAAKPGGVSFEQAAAVPLAGQTALQGLRDHGQVKQGQKVLILGASGGVGTFAVQIAKDLGAEVTGVCSTRNVELVRSLGADHVIDYKNDDFAAGGARYDVILQVSGWRSPRDCRRALVGDGTLVSISGDAEGRLLGPVGRMVKTLALGRFVSQRMVTFTVKPSGADMRALAELLETGKLTPAIDRTYPLGEVGEAIRYMEQEHTRGKVAVTVGSR